MDFSLPASIFFSPDSSRPIKPERKCITSLKGHIGLMFGFITSAADSQTKMDSALLFHMSATADSAVLGSNVHSLKRMGLI